MSHVFVSLAYCRNSPYTIELAAEAIRGHKSAHSLATGPVIADPAQPLIPLSKSSCGQKAHPIPKRKQSGATSLTLILDPTLFNALTGPADCNTKQAKSCHLCNYVRQSVVAIEAAAAI